MTNQLHPMVYIQEKRKYTSTQSVHTDLYTSVTQSSQKMQQLSGTSIQWNITQPIKGMNNWCMTGHSWTLKTLCSVKKASHKRPHVITFIVDSQKCQIYVYRGYINDRLGPGRLQFMESLRVGHDWVTSLSLSCVGEGNGNPLQCSCLENPRDGGAWWAAISGVAQSRTRLKRLSSSRARGEGMDSNCWFFWWWKCSKIGLCSWLHNGQYIWNNELFLI